MDRFKSRKFWLTVLSMVVMLFTAGGADAATSGDLTALDPIAGLLAAGVGVLYVFVQGRVDRASGLGQALSGKVNEDVLEELLTRLRDQDTLPAPPPPPDEDRGEW